MSKYLYVLSLVIMLSACGGGGGGSSAQPNSLTPDQSLQVLVDLNNKTVFNNDPANVLSVVGLMAPR